jgi:lysophospholipase L1-like esterase
VLQYDIADYSGFLYVDAVANYKNQFWVIHDESGNILSKSITYEDNDKHYLVDDKVEIPKNAKYLYVQTFVKDNVAKVVQKEAVYFSPKLWKGIKWGVLGDSLTAINSRTTKHYFDYISELTGIEVVNLAVSGSSYGQPQESGNAFFQQASRLPSDVDVVTIFGSFNSWGADDNGTIDDTEPTTRYGCINKAIETIYSINPLARVGIVSPTPWGNNGYNPFISDNGNDWGQRTVDRIKDVCYKRGIPFLDLYHTSELRPWDLEYRRLVYSKEDDPETQGVHPNELGHKILSTHFKSFLDKLILSL